MFKLLSALNIHCDHLHPDNILMKEKVKCMADIKENMMVIYIYNYLFDILFINYNFNLNGHHKFL